jgi:predicted Zn-dependent peptidase
MIEIQKHQLDNGLKILINHDRTSPIAAMNLLYGVGARDEDPEKTGFAHLFEHLMFGGSKRIPSYDEPLQRASGENNAFTTNDITNYYLTLPAQNLETGFWLESDRMSGLDFSQRNLDVQKNVVIEEFKQRYLNQPYGDTWLLLRPLAYRHHPYQWATIGKDIRHIEQATLEDVRTFFYSYYAPNNAILSISSSVDPDQILIWAEKWFGPIEARPLIKRQYPSEYPQEETREATVYREVPYNSIHMSFHMPGRSEPGYHATDLLSDLLGNGSSSRLYQSLVKEKKYFGEINAFITGNIDPGLLVISGNLLDGIPTREAFQAVVFELDRIRGEGVRPEELEKVKNKVETTLVFSEISNLHRAMNMAYFENLGDAHRMNQEPVRYKAVTGDDIRSVSKEILDISNASTLFYLTNNA